MIIVRFQGGLGNQMSQFAFYRKLQNIYGEGKVGADISYYEYHHAHNGFELGEVFPNTKSAFHTLSRTEIRRRTKLIPERYTVDSLTDFPNRQLEYIRVHYNGLIQKFQNCFSYNRMLVQDVESDVHEQVEFYGLDPEKDWYLYGYWYQYDYVCVWKQLQQDFTFDTERVKCHAQTVDKMQNEDSVSVHIRGGDYLNSPYAVLGTHYYQEAIDLIYARVQNPHFYVFSDDPEYAERILAGINADSLTFVEQNRGHKAWHDLYLMSRCRHHIMANSTFSMWGTLLSSEPAGVVIGSLYETRTRKYAVKPEWIQLEKE